MEQSGHSVLQKNGGEWRQLDEQGMPVAIEGEAKALETLKLVDAAFPGEEKRGLRKNVEFWVGLRNKVAHRFIPSLDIVAIPKAQATLMNLENALDDEFGADFGLGNSLSVPLQLAGFRDTAVLGSLKALQASLPIDIQAFLAREGEQGLEGDPTYTLRVAFIPVVPSSGRSPDSVSYFVRPGEVGDELEDALQKFVVVPKIMRTKRPELSATDVVNRVKAEIPYALTTHHHKQAAISLQVRPPDGVPDPGLTDPRYCEYVAPVHRYLYTSEWVKRLVSELSTEDGFLKSTGSAPRLR